MIITDGLKKEIVEEVKMLEDVGDCVGIIMGNNKGLFILVHDDFNEGKEYLVELNDIVDGAFEPCVDVGYNAYSKFGDMEKLVEEIEDYLQNIC